MLEMENLLWNGRQIYYPVWVGHRSTRGEWKRREQRPPLTNEQCWQWTVPDALLQFFNND
jgi:hypothetical protein